MDVCFPPGHPDGMVSVPVNGFSKKNLLALQNMKTKVYGKTMVCLFKHFSSTSTALRFSSLHGFLFLSKRNSLSLVVLIGVALNLPLMSLRAEKLDAEEIEAIDFYIMRQGMDPEIIRGREGEVIRELVNRLTVESQPGKRILLLWTIGHSLQKIKSLDAETLFLANNALYGCLKQKLPNERSDAVRFIADVGGKNGLRRILPMIQDADLGVRLTAVNAFEEYGDAEDAHALEDALNYRARERAKVDNKEDVTLTDGYKAVEKMRLAKVNPEKEIVEKSVTERNYVAIGDELRSKSVEVSVMTAKLVARNMSVREQGPVWCQWLEDDEAWNCPIGDDCKRDSLLEIQLIMMGGLMSDIGYLKVLSKKERVELVAHIKKELLRQPPPDDHLKEEGAEKRGKLKKTLDDLTWHANP